MSLPHMAFLVQPTPSSRSSCGRLWPLLHSAMDCLDNQAIRMRFCCNGTPLKFSTIPMAISSSLAKRHFLGEVDGAEARECNDIEMHSERNGCSNLHYIEGLDEVGGRTCHETEVTLTCSMNELKETLRRRRIGLANKGRVPWNKGRKHSPETCARIRERTLEAMRDPKVRRKMSESPRLHSEQSKKKIGTSLRQLWAERLKMKRSKEKFFLSWAGSIADAARRGGINEEQLSWDSYEKLKKEMATRRLHLDEEMAKGKELKRIRAEKRGLEKAEKMAQRARKKLERENIIEPRAKQKAIKSCKKRKKKEELSGSRGSSFKSRLQKGEGTKLIDGPSSNQIGVMTYLQSALEKFDIESIKEEQRRNRISLADQIQAAKKKRQSSPLDRQ